MSRIPEFNFDDVTTENCDAWIRKLNSAGLLYHFDDSPTTIIEFGTGNRTFTDEEAEELGPIMDAMFSVDGYDPFDIAVDLVNEV